MKSTLINKFKLTFNPIKLILPTLFKIRKLHQIIFFTLHFYKKFIKNQKLLIKLLSFLMNSKILLKTIIIEIKKNTLNY